MVGARPKRPASQCLLQSSATLVRIAADSGFIRAVEGEGRPRGLKTDVLVTRERVLIRPLVYKEGESQ